jgi:hypothetical protein
MLKMLFIDLSIQNILVPYVYLLYCQKVEDTFKEDYESAFSFNSTYNKLKQSKKEVDPEQEYAYNSDEDSVIQEGKSANAKKHIFNDVLKGEEGKGNKG